MVLAQWVSKTFREFPGIPSGKVLVSFEDLERGVCSSIGHLRPRIREPEGGSAPASGASLAFLVSFGDLERGVCSSIGHLRPRIREPEGGSAPASVSEFGKRFHGCPGMRGGCPQVSPVGSSIEKLVCTRSRAVTPQNNAYGAPTVAA